MNILHHKSWHVRTKANITRVRRDEENARQNELEKERRILLAEQEARTQLLRDKAESGSQRVTTTVVEGSKPSKHIDIFGDFKDKIKTTNFEHEKEVKEEKEKWETSNGILSYLTNKEKDSDNNWYLDSHEIRMKITDNNKDKNTDTTNFKDFNVKKFNDPLENMRRYLDVMKNKGQDKGQDNSHKKNMKTIQFVKSNDSKKSEKRNKHKKKKRKRHSSDSSEDSKKVSKSLEQLRAERLKREKVERERTRALFSSRSGTKSDAVIMDDRMRTYNSQFNPQIARQNIDK